MKNKLKQLIKDYEGCIRLTQEKIDTSYYTNYTDLNAAQATVETLEDVIESLERIVNS